MTLTEQVLATRESRGTGSALAVSAVSLLLAASQYQVTPIAEAVFLETHLQRTQAQGSARAGVRVDGRATELVRALHRVYDEILRNQVDLDPDSRHALYSNLWSLYE